MCSGRAPWWAPPLGHVLVIGSESPHSSTFWRTWSTPRSPCCRCCPCWWVLLLHAATAQICDITYCVLSPGLWSVWSLRGPAGHLQHPLPLPVLHPLAADWRTVHAAYGRTTFPHQLLQLYGLAPITQLLWSMCSGGSTAVPHRWPDAPPPAVWDAVSAAHELPALPALQLPPHRRR